MTALTDALDSADREIDRAESALAESKRLMRAVERAPRSQVKRDLLAELDSAAALAGAARQRIASSPETP